MMNIPETAGEPSCKRQENGDASTGSERPLKKARFAWQVKGKSKYHLKNDAPESETSPPSEPENPQSSQSESSSHDLVGNTEQNLEILGDYLLKQDFNTLDSVITDPDKSLLKPSTSIESEKLDYPRYVTSFESNESGSGHSPSDQMAVPMSRVMNYTEEYCIARWQAGQMAKAFVDNTINRVLDSWMAAPIPADIENRFLALDVAEFINNLPGDDSIENEGILMAISAHGLQNNSGSSSNDNSQAEAQNLSTKDESSRSNSPSPSKEQNEKEEKLEFLDWTQFNEEDGDHVLSFCDNEEMQQAFDEDSLINDFSSRYDFMDAAVSYAIQNKGLTSFGTDYG